MGFSKISGSGFARTTSSKQTISGNSCVRPAESSNVSMTRRWLLEARIRGIPFHPNSAASHGRPVLMLLDLAQRAAEFDQKRLG